MREQAKEFTLNASKKSVSRYSSPVLEVVSVLHLRTDLTLGLGKVVHDYLR